MNKALTVAQLIERLQKIDPEAEVWVEREGEHRRCEHGDVHYMKAGDDSYLYDADEGGEYENQTGLVVFASWS